MISRIFYRYNFLYVALCVIALLQAQLLYTISQHHGCYNPQALVAFLDIGQGDSIYIQDTDGKNVLIDTGPRDDGLISQIQKVTECADVHIDTLILTHPDADHIGEAKHLTDKGLVTELDHNGFLDIDQPDETMMENELEKTNVLKKKIHAGDKLLLRDIAIETLYPIDPPYMIEMSTSSKKKGKKNKASIDDNIYSLVTKVTYTGAHPKTFLLTGDAPSKVEDILMSTYNTLLQSNVLKLGHHGSKNSSSQSFLEAVAPDEVVVSAAKQNRYNHPSPETMERVYDQRRKKPLVIRETFVEGNIVYHLE